MSEENKTTSIVIPTTDGAKHTPHYIKLEILQLAAELEGIAAQAKNPPVAASVTDILVTADRLADFVFSEEPVAE